MRTDKEILQAGMNALSEKLGKVEAEKFITLIIKEPFDYTRWSQEMFKGLSVRELSHLAAENTKEIH